MVCDQNPQTLDCVEDRLIFMKHKLCVWILFPRYLIMYMQLFQSPPPPEKFKTRSVQSISIKHTDLYFIEPDKRAVSGKMLDYLE